MPTDKMVTEGKIHNLVIEDSAEVLHQRLGQLNQLRKSRHFCDVVLQVSNKRREREKEKKGKGERWRRRNIKGGRRDRGRGRWSRGIDERRWYRDVIRRNKNDDMQTKRGRLQWKCEFQRRTTWIEDRGVSKRKVKERRVEE